MLVFVKDKSGEALMPCKPSKARKLIKQKKAKIIDYKPFTIQLLYGSSGYKQKVNIGVDLGARHLGLAVTTKNKVLAKGEIELRQDVKSLLLTRASYRSSRRNRKTRYRKPRFLNRTKSKKKGWLPPSIKSRIDNSFMWIDKFNSLVPNPQLSIEVGKFDIAKMINPDIAGVDYQQGQAYGYHDVRYFVFARDNYTCQVCSKQGKILNTHHILYKTLGGSDRADNLITVCTDCHTSKNHKKGNILHNWMVKDKKTKSYKEGPFMNIFRRKIFIRYPSAKITYGSITTPRRKELHLEKTHYNDAISISGIEDNFIDNNNYFYIKQFRKKKRSLHEATARKGRKTPNINQSRNSKNTKFMKGIQLNDKIKLFNKVGFVTGFCQGGLYVKDIDNNYITKPNKSYKQVSFNDIEVISHNNNWQMISDVKTM